MMAWMGRAWCICEFDACNNCLAMTFGTVYSSKNIITLQGTRTIILQKGYLASTIWVKMDLLRGSIGKKLKWKSFPNIVILSKRPGEEYYVYITNVLSFIGKGY
jgi:hypothetical protein